MYLVIIHLFLKNCLKKCTLALLLKGQVSYFFDFFLTDINSRSNCKTHHVFKIFNFAL